MLKKWRFKYNISYNSLYNHYELQLIISYINNDENKYKKIIKIKTDKGLFIH
jgi:hypothetical protein